MKKYQIVEISENYNHAGTKATQDIAEVADGLKYERILIRMNTTKKNEACKSTASDWLSERLGRMSEKSRRKFGYSATASVSLSAVDQRENTDGIKRKKTCKIYQSDS